MLPEFRMTGARCYKKVVSMFLNGQQKRHIQCSDGNTTNLIEKDLDMQGSRITRKSVCIKATIFGGIVMQGSEFSIRNRKKR